MRNVKRLVAGTLTMLGIILFGCTKEKEAPLAPVLSSAPYKAFVPPTAEEALSCRNTTCQRISTMDRPESFLRLSLPKPGAGRGRSASAAALPLAWKGSGGA